MANQITIDIGAVANDGTGDPLRTAFNYVNNNFSNVWNTGLPNSNVQFSDNRILTVNSNANLVLAPNGIAKVVSNVSILPNMSNVHSMGSSDRRWNTLYAQYLDISNDITFGDLTVDGNLTVTGNIIEIGNIVTDAKTIQLANTAGTANAANGSGITVGASDNIATLLYNSTSNTWTTNIGVSVTGNVTGNYIIGNGALLTGLAATYGNANVAAYLPTYTGNLSAGNASVTNVVAAQNISATNGTFTGDQFSDGAMYVGSPAGTVLGSDVVIQITANSGSYSQTNFQNINSGVTASSDYILTADNGNNTTHYLDLGITSSGWDGSETNVLAGLVANNGYLYVQDGNLTVGTRNGNISYGWNFDTTGNLTVPKDIIPTANNTQNLGSATRQWNDLYLSNATIYMNSVPISLTAGNVLTVNGADVVTTAANGVTSLGNVGFTGDAIYDLNGMIIENADLSHGATAAVILPANGDANAIQVNNTYGNIILQTGAGSGITASWSFDNTGNLVIPGVISSSSTIDLDNRATSNSADIRLYSADDMFLQGRDKPDDLEAEGGDINIYAGVGAAAVTVGFDTGGGGDVQIYGGTGGAAEVTATSGSSGGFVSIRGGDGGGSVDSNVGSGGDINLTAGSAPGAANTALGGFGGGVNIIAGTTTRINENGGSIELSTGGASGDGTGAAGYVSINIASSNVGPGGQWIFSGTGTTLNVPANAEIFGASVGNFTVGCAGNTIVTSSDYGANVQNWVFGYTGNLDLPQGVKLGDYPGVGSAANTIALSGAQVYLSNTNGTSWVGVENNVPLIGASEGIPTSTANINSQGGYNIGSYTGLSTTGGSGSGLTVNASTAGNGYINTVTINTPGSGYTNGDTITIVGGDGLGCTFTIGVPFNQWTFGTTGSLTLPTIDLGTGLDAQAIIQSQRKLIPPLRYSAVIDADNPTIVYTATNVDTTSMKVTMQVQHAGLGMEFFEVFATFTGSDTFYTVNNRVAPTTIEPSTVVVGLTGTPAMKITVTVNSGAATSWVTYDAVEFGIAVD